MHLLEHTADGKLILTTFLGDDIPREYAILSHTWGGEEVTFRDIKEGTGSTKAGYKKILFCGEQAKRDNLRYFWVDTCCIDKTNSTELSEAINSMFQWYRNSTKCYVFLADVSVTERQESFRGAFRSSRWFTRGWTLQELIAPRYVELFNVNGSSLGTRKSLKSQIEEVSGIPAMALEGNLELTTLSVTERMSWANHRSTTIKEDFAYSLLGIFDVHMPLIYGEGKDKALKRLYEEIEKNNKGHNFINFDIPFSLYGVKETEHFVGREDELSDIRKALKSDGTRRTVVLHGLGGIGKTQLSIEYARRHKRSYSAVFWMNAKDEDALKRSFVRVAKQIDGGPSRAALAKSSHHCDDDNKEAIVTVKAWLSQPQNTRWLLIFDNYDNPKTRGNSDPAAVDIYDYLPEVYQGSIIITSRSAQIRMGTSLPIRNLTSIDECLHILSDSSRRPQLMEDVDAMLLVKELDGLPLALATAGAYLDQVTISVADYLRLYRESWKRLQGTSPELDSYEDRTLASTWLISYDYVKKQSALSARLLKFWAYLDNNDLWYELINQKDHSDPAWFQELYEDEISFHGAMRVLCNHGLAERQPLSMHEAIRDLSGESQGYSLHGCVHAWSVHVLNQDWDAVLAKLAIKSVVSHIRTATATSKESYVTTLRLLAHTNRCSTLATVDILGSETYGESLESFGNLYERLEIYSKAEEMYTMAVNFAEQYFGSEHETTNRRLTTLAVLYHKQRRFADARNLYEQVVQNSESTLNSASGGMLDGIGYLAVLCDQEHKLVETESLLQRALGTIENDENLDFISLARTLHNLGLVYYRQRRYDEAEQMYLFSLQSRETIYGVEHGSTLESGFGLLLVYLKQGRLELAETMCRRVISGRQKALGPHHSWTLQALISLGLIYMSQGRIVAAEETFLGALSGLEMTASNHECTLLSSYYLSLIYHEQKRFSELLQVSEPLLARLKTIVDLETSILSETIDLWTRMLQLSCFAEVRLSRLGNVFDHISTLAGLTLIYPPWRVNMLNRLGRLLAFTGSDEDAKKALAYHHHIASFEEACLCDGCDKSLDAHNARMVCAVCYDMDLCDVCFEKHCQNESEFIPSCKGHKFLMVDSCTSEELTAQEKAVVDIQAMERWLANLITQYEPQNLEIEKHSGRAGHPTGHVSNIGTRQ